MVYDRLDANKCWNRTFFLKIFMTTVFTFICLNTLPNDIAAQQADIAILLPSSESGVAEGDVNYARTVSKRFVRMLNSIGFSADQLDESSVASKPRFQANSTNPYRLIILPLNPKISLKTTPILENYVRSEERRVGKE